MNTATYLKTFTAIDLLDKTIEFTTLVPGASLWKESALKENSPYLLRFRQIQSLIKAFFGQKAPTNFMQKAKALFTSEPSVTIQSLLSGAFIPIRDVEQYNSTAEFIKAIVKEKEPLVDMQPSINLDKLTLVYQYLIDYKKNLSALLLFNTGQLKEGSIASRFTGYITSSITEQVRGKYNQLDEALELLINPHGDTFTEEQLRSEYNYPAQDLREVEADFRLKHAH
jgi:hypothetical protein